MPRVLLVGFSHVQALIQAYEQRMLQKCENAFDMKSILLEPHGRHRPTPTQASESLVSYEAIQDDMRKFIADSNPDLIVVSLWGNQHFFLCASNDPRPYDFILPEEPDRELTEDAEIIPYDLMESFVTSLCAKAYNVVPFFRTFTPLPIVSISAPPPVEHPLEIPGGTSSKDLDAKVQELGLAPATLRYKYWKLCEGIFRERSKEQDVPFLPVPAETVDKKGFRYREYYGKDWIHASTSYGELVLHQLDKMLT